MKVNKSKTLLQVRWKLWPTAFDFAKIFTNLNKRAALSHTSFTKASPLFLLRFLHCSRFFDRQPDMTYVISSENPFLAKRSRKIPFIFLSFFQILANTFFLNVFENMVVWALREAYVCIPHNRKTKN